MDKKQYTAPKLTVVSFKIEEGFAGSNERSLLPTLELEEPVQGSQQNWASEDQTFFNRGWN